MMVVSQSRQCVGVCCSKSECRRSDIKLQENLIREPSRMVPKQTTRLLSEENHAHDEWDSVIQSILIGTARGACAETKRGC